MPDKVNLAHAFNLEPREAVKYFRGKGVKVSENWWDVWKEQHARSFVVARGAKFGALETIRVAMLKSLERGTTERQFIKELEPRLKRRGWWGRRESDGRMLGSHSRLKTIYRTNSAAAYNAGRYREQKRRAERGTSPYWQYIAVLDASTRDQHRALNDKVFRHDDPFWDYFYPPNGFNCRCRVRTLSERDLKRHGLKVESSADKLFKSRQRIGVDRETGEIIDKEVTGYRGRDIAGRKVTVKPHAGFDYNPGKEWSWNPSGNTPTDPAKIVPPKPVASSPFKRGNWESLGKASIEEIDGEEQLLSFPRARSAGEAKKIIKDLVFHGEDYLKIDSPIGDMIIRPEDFSHALENFGDHREVIAGAVRPTIMRPNEVWLQEILGGKDEIHFIKAFRRKRDNAPIVCVFRGNVNNANLVTFYKLRERGRRRRDGIKYINSIRKGALLHEGV